MRTMYDIIKDGYAAGKISKTGLKKAVTRKWISETEYKTITGEDYATATGSTAETTTADTGTSATTSTDTGTTTA
jgi:hypothetical protein